MSTDSDPQMQTIMSADIAGSTALYEALGDTNAQALVNDCLTTLKSYCTEHNGHTIAEVGDQVIARFEDPSDAAGVASEIHIHLAEQNERGASSPIRMRIGVHSGPLPSSRDLLTCTTVKIANWASDKAKPEQTLATLALIEQLPRIFRAVQPRSLHDNRQQHERICHSHGRR